MSEYTEGMMIMAEEPTKLTTQEARAGESRGKMRYVLMIGTVLAVVVLGWLALGSGADSTNMESGSAPASETM